MTTSIIPSGLSCMMRSLSEAYPLSEWELRGVFSGGVGQLGPLKADCGCYGTENYD